MQISDRMYVEILRRLSVYGKTLTKISFAAYGNIRLFRVVIFSVPQKEGRSIRRPKE
jgi:hypothetical protein